MFKDPKAFSSFSVDNLEAAKKFYTEVLGLAISDNPMGVLELHIAGSADIMVYPKPNHEPATFTVLNFLVPNIVEAVDALTQKGVAFEHYTTEHLKTDEKGIAWGDGRGPNIAWFKDPAHNIFSVIEEK